MVVDLLVPKTDTIKYGDYVVLFRSVGGTFAFVEVKSPRESIRPSQRHFFPELVRTARNAG